MRLRSLPDSLEVHPGEEHQLAIHVGFLKSDCPTGLQKIVQTLWADIIHEKSVQSAPLFCLSSCS